MIHCSFASQVQWIYIEFISVAAIFGSELLKALLIGMQLGTVICLLEQMLPESN